MRARMKLTLCLIVATSSGCAGSQGVRYVYQDGNFGVVGMPENTDHWPSRYRHKADKLMEEHFPDGHEIVRAEEVTEGERTLKVEGSKTAEVTPQAATSIINVAKFGRTSSRSQADTTKIKECRIIYRRIGSPEVPSGFAAAADPTPTLYVDPNVVERHKMVGGGDAAKPTPSSQSLPDKDKVGEKPHPDESQGKQDDSGWGM